jgi:probable HAF family extracellular repeat protein
VTVRRFCCALCLLQVAFATPVLAQSYTLVDLGALGGSRSFANGIAGNGIVAGNATTSESVKHAALWDEGGVMDLGAPPGFVVSDAVAVNPSRQAAGNGEGNPQSYQAYLWDSGLWTPLGVLPGRMESLAADIDSAGRIAGSSFTLGAGDDRGFLWEAGVMTDLGTLGGATSAQGMNDAGQVVGYSFASLPEGGQAGHAFLWEDSVMADLGVLPGEDESWAFDVNDGGDAVGSSWHLTIPNLLAAHRATLWRDGGAEIVDLGRTPGPPRCIFEYPFYTANIARAINNQGQVVGEAMCVASGGPLAAFFWEDGVMHNLNDLVAGAEGWDLLSARDINDAGEIVGIGVDPEGDLHGFLLTPTSTPVRGTPHERFALAVSPNPFRNGTRVSFVLPQRTRVRLTVHDVLGRRIATLVEGMQGPGPHAVTWPAAGNAGGEVASGIYFLRFEGEEWVETRKMIVLH